MKFVRLPGLASVALLAACATSPQAPLPEGMVQCPTPRPQVCTMEYNPVCAVLGDGKRKEFANGCSACGDAEVTGHVAGPCE